MLRQPLIALGLVLATAQAQDTLPAVRPLPLPHEPSGTFADTVLIDAVLDSMKGWIRSGRHDITIANVPQLRSLLTGMGDGKPEPAMDPRELQATKLEGIAHYYAGEYPSALRAFQHFQRVAERIGSAELIGAAHSYQSYQYREMNEVARARTSIRRAVDILRTLPPGDDLANALTGLASVQADQDQLDSALLSLREAVSIYKRTGNAMNRGSSLANMADAFIQAEQFDSAVVRLTEAMPLVEASGNMQLIMSAHAQQGRALHGLKRYAAAEKELRKAEELATELEHDEALGRIHDVQALIAARNDDPGKALKLLQAGRNALIRDLDLAKVSEITEVRLTAEHEREKQIAAAELATEKLRGRNTIIASIGILVITMLLLVLLLNTRRNATRLRGKNEEIIRTQTRLVEAEKQRENEQVRTRIARDIHDEIGSGLTKIALLSSEAKRRAHGPPDELRDTLERITTHSRAVSAALSEIVWSVDPEHDTSTELMNHARNVAHRLLGDSGVSHDLRFHHIDPAHPVAPGTKHHIMLVMKEAINNALKYAEATHITVQLEAGAQHFNLLVRDDGRGFAPLPMARTGNGMRNMKARAQAIGARLTLQSTLGHGCTVEVDGPLA